MFTAWQGFLSSSKFLFSNDVLSISYSLLVGLPESPTIYFKVLSTESLQIVQHPKNAAAHIGNYNYSSAGWSCMCLAKWQ